MRTLFTLTLLLIPTAVAQALPPQCPLPPQAPPVKPKCDGKCDNCPCPNGVCPKGCKPKCCDGNCPDCKCADGCPCKPKSKAGPKTEVWVLNGVPTVVEIVEGKLPKVVGPAKAGQKPNLSPSVPACPNGNCPKPMPSFRFAPPPPFLTSPPCAGPT